MQQAQQQIELQHGQILNRSIEAKAQSDFANAKKNQAAAVAEMSLAKERSSKSQQESAAATLSHVKTLKELREMDDDRLIKVAQFVMAMEDREKAMTMADEQDSEVEAERESSLVSEAQRESKPSAFQQQMSTQMQ
jgi:hypothetical protein